MYKTKKILNLILFFTLLLGVVFLQGCTKKGDEKPGKNEMPVKLTPTPAPNGIFRDNGDGTVSFSYNNTNDKRCKVVIQEENGKMYQYDIPQGKCDMTFPLSEGNGTYKVYFCKNVKDNRYSVIESTSIVLDIDDDKQTFLGSNVVIDWDETNEAIKKAQKLTKDLDDDKSKLEAIHGYMVENYSYDYEKADKVNSEKNEMAYVPSIDDTFSSCTGICYDLSSLLAAMLRSVDIPAKVVTGYTNNNVSYHAWNSVFYTPQKDWETVDITYDIEMHKEKRRFSIFKNPKDYDKVIYVY